MPTPVLVHEATANRQDYLAGWVTAKAAVQSIVTQYDALGLVALTPSEFSRLFNDTEGLIFDKITGGDLEVGSITISRSEAIKMVQKPAGYEALISAIANLNTSATQGYGDDFLNKITFSLGQISSVFILDGANTVQYSSYVQSAIDKWGKTFASTTNSIAVYNFLQDVVAAYFSRGLHTTYKAPLRYGIPDYNPIEMLVGLINQINDNGTFTIHPKPFAQGDIVLNNIRH